MAQRRERIRCLTHSIPFGQISSKAQDLSLDLRSTGMRCEQVPQFNSLGS
jgi:hypothetical protein